VETAFSSTALLVAIAAVLWIVYLVPVWVKRTEYLATERNATRLGQTLRVFAETAEASPELRAELTAREVWRKSREAERAVKHHGLTDSQRSAKRRRLARVTLTVFTTISLIAFVAAITAGSASWVIGATGGKVLTGLLALVVIAQRTKTHQPSEGTHVSRNSGNEPATSARAWTPPEIPEPLSARQKLPQVSDSLPPREELLRQARQAASSARPDEAAREKETLAPVSRFDQMGVLEQGTKQPTPNLDEVLQRRRAV
jgi:hypothetical protein